MQIRVIRHCGAPPVSVDLDDAATHDVLTGGSSKMSWGIFAILLIDNQRGIELSISSLLVFVRMIC